MPEAAQKPPAAAAGAGAWTDPLRNYNFKLQIDGVNEGHFAQVTSIGIRLEAISYPQPGVQHRMPGRVEYSDITLRYGLTASKELWTWFMNIVNGKVERKHVSIIMLGTDGVTPVTRWNLYHAWPREWCSPLLDARGQETAIESLTLVFESLDRV